MLQLRCTWKRICGRSLLGVENISPLVLQRTFFTSPVQILKILVAMKLKAACKCSPFGLTTNLSHQSSPNSKDFSGDEAKSSLQVLTEDQKKQAAKGTKSGHHLFYDRYERDGYIVVPDVYRKDHVKELNKVLDEYIEESRKLKQTDNLFVLDPHHTAEKPILLRLRCISNHSKLFKDTMCDPKLVEIVSDLIGPSDRYINQEKVNMKPPQSSSSLIRWHQDWAFLPYTNDSLVTVCISIDDSTRENGCLQVIPGSHKGPLYSHFQEEAFVSAITDPALDPSSAVHLEVPAGGVSFHHAFTVHGSSANRSNCSRRLLCLNYSTADNWPLLGVGGHEFTNHGPVDWGRYCSTVIKGKPSVYPRMQAWPVSIPVPFEAGYDIYEHSKASDVSEPTE